MAPATGRTARWARRRCSSGAGPRIRGRSSPRPRAPAPPAGRRGGTSLTSLAVAWPGLPFWLEEGRRGRRRIMFSIFGLYAWARERSRWTGNGTERLDQRSWRRGGRPQRQIRDIAGPAAAGIRFAAGLSLRGASRGRFERSLVWPDLRSDDAAPQRHHAFATPDSPFRPLVHDRRRRGGLAPGSASPPGGNSGATGRRAADATGSCRQPADAAGPADQIRAEPGRRRVAGACRVGGSSTARYVRTTSTPAAVRRSWVRGFRARQDFRNRCCFRPSRAA